MGDTQQTVEVKAGAALINTEGGSISGQLDKAKITDAPVIDSYPEPNALILTLPGVQGAGWDMKISGQDSSQQSMQVDGVSNDRSGEQSNNMHFFDEVTVATVNAPADSSRVVAYNLTSKRGQNQFLPFYVRRQVDIFDPDGTRVELMEPNTATAALFHRPQHRRQPLRISSAS